MEDEVLAMVVRTGMCTSMGAMMRQVVHSARPMSNPLVQVRLSDGTGQKARDIYADGIVARLNST